MLQRARRQAGLSQQELAERAGLSLRGIADLERGVRRAPYPTTVRQLVEALGLDETARAGLIAAAQPHVPTDGLVHVEPTLPLPLSSFVGRGHEIAAVQDLLNTARLVTLTGIGGIGKTRLALEVARASPYAVFVDLAPLIDGGLVPAAIAGALGIREQPGVPLLELLSSYLASRDRLLVLDNCEHLVQAAAELAEALLHTCARLRILATSRERLGVAGERTWQVPALSVPEPEEPIESLQACEATCLFLQRAAAVRADFSLTPENGPIVASLCRRLEGIPLAIELAAARVNVLAVDQIAERLDDAVRVLGRGTRTAPARQQTLQATFEWSYGLLSEPERLLLARLSVFVGGLTLEAAEAVCSDHATDQHLPAGRLQPEHILDLLGQLADKSLVQAESASYGGLRYRLLEPLRQFAAQRLVETGGADMLRERHARWFAALVAEAASHYHGPKEAVALEELEREHANIQSALDWRLQQPDQAAAARVANDLLWFWIRRNRVHEAQTRLEHLLDGFAAAGTPGQPELLWSAAVIAWLQGDFVSAWERFMAALDAARQGGDDNLVARTLSTASRIAIARGEYATAREFLEEGLPLARLTGDRWSEGRHLDGLALLAIDQGDLAAARQLLEHAANLARAEGDDWSLATILITLGDVARSERDHGRARRLYEEMLSLTAGLGTMLPSILHNLAHVAVHERDHDRALALFSESLLLFQRRGEQRGMAECLVGFACVAAAAGEHERAARFFGAAEAAFELLGVQLSPSNRADHSLGLAAAHAGCRDAEFATAYAAGRRLSLDEAAAEMLSVDPGTPGPPPPGRRRMEPRERNTGRGHAGTRGE
jgi:predicted ATPase/DNA-binding XRE family transcriptional regulator